MMLEIFLRLFLSGLSGLIIGWEREYRSKEAGHRTHFLVALGSSLFMIVSQYGFGDFLDLPHVSFDPSRIASQVVTGIGFLGAGTIIFKQNYVRGLTTAACIWTTAAIGLAVGAGLYAIGGFTTILVVLILETMNIFHLGKIQTSIELKTNGVIYLNKIYEELNVCNCVINSCRIEENTQNKSFSISLQIQGTKKKVEKFILSLNEMQNISVVKWENNER